MSRNYFIATRALLVASLHEHLEPIEDLGLRLLVKMLPTDPFAAAHVFCAITGLPRSVKRAFIKHNVSIAYEAHQLLKRREQTDFVKLNGAETQEKPYMAATSQSIDKARFHRINRFIKDQRSKGVYNADHIAKHFGVSPSTVRTIARMGTYPKFVARKAERAAHNRNVKKAVETRKVNPTPQPEQLPLTPAPRRYAVTELTRDEYRELVSLKERVEAFEDWRKNRLEAEKALIALNQADELQPRRKWWRFW